MAKTDPHVLLAQAVRGALNSIICTQSGPVAPCFDEFDYARERARGSSYTIEKAAIDQLSAALQEVEKDRASGKTRAKR